jgi:hypothetical protein
MNSTQMAFPFSMLKASLFNVRHPGMTEGQVIIAVSWTVPIGMKAAQTTLDVQSILERGTREELGDVQASWM